MYVSQSPTKKTERASYGFVPVSEGVRVLSLVGCLGLGSTFLPAFSIQISPRLRVGLLYHGGSALPGV